jgi:hypothetical protein
MRDGTVPSSFSSSQVQGRRKQKLNGEKRRNDDSDLIASPPPSQHPPPPPCRLAILETRGLQRDVVYLC